MPRTKTDGTRNKNRLPLPSSIPTGTRAVTVCIPDGDEYFMYLVGAMYRLGQQVWYDRDTAKTAQHVAQVWRDALAKTLAGDCASPTEPEPDRPTIDEIIAGGYATKTMCNHVTQQFNGLWYFGIDCGCGNIQWIPIGHAVQLDPTTNAPVPPEQASAIFNNPTSANEPCYAAASVDYLLARFRQWLNFGLGTVTTALDETFLVFDDVASVAMQFLSKSDERNLWDALIEQGEDDIYAQVAQHRAAYIADFSLTAPIRAADVQKLFTAHTGTWTLAGQAVILWIKTSKLLGITKDLSKLAADCEANAGTSQLAPLLPEPMPIQQWLGPVAEPNNQLEKYTYYFNEALTANEQTLQTEPNENAELIVAIAVYGTAISSSTENYWRIGNSTTQIFRGRITDQTAAEPLRMFTYDPYNINTIEPTTPTRTDSLNSTSPAPIFITTEVWDNTTAEVFIEKIEIWKLKE